MGDEETGQLKRRKNQILDADYDPKEVHATTCWRWQRKLKQFKESLRIGKYIIKVIFLKCKYHMTFVSLKREVFLLYYTLN